jgi:MinD-like ATPase involved in chromosome partitioning or flagellar assembly
VPAEAPPAITTPTPSEATTAAPAEGKTAPPAEGKTAPPAEAPAPTKAQAGTPTPAEAPAPTKAEARAPTPTEAPVPTMAQAPTPAGGKAPTPAEAPATPPRAAADGREPVPTPTPPTPTPPGPPAAQAAAPPPAWAGQGAQAPQARAAQTNETEGAQVSDGGERLARTEPGEVEAPAGELRDDQVLSRLPGGPLWGWQAVVYRISGGRWRPPPGPAEQAHRALEARITTPIEGCRRIAVVALKGGVGKTTTTACLGAVFAEHRGDRVVAVDANPDPGTLGYRIRRDTLRTARDLLADAAKLERYADVRAYASQTTLRLEVIASEADPARSEAFDEEDYRELAAVLERFYSLVLTDCGPGLLHSAMQAILPAADQLVVVSAPSLDGARSASLTLDWLERHGHAALAKSSVVVINAVRDRGLVDVDKLEQHFARRCRAVVRVPFDRHLETGAEIVLDELAQSTRRSYLELAAAVADGFGRHHGDGSPG